MVQFNIPSIHHGLIHLSSHAECLLRLVLLAQDSISVAESSIMYMILGGDFLFVWELNVSIWKPEGGLHSGFLLRYRALTIGWEFRLWVFVFPV